MCYIYAFEQEVTQPGMYVICRIVLLAVDIQHVLVCLDMWHDHPCTFVLTLSNVLTLCCLNWLLWHVIHKTPFWVSVHFSCVSEANNWLLTVIEAIYCIQIWYIFVRRNLFGDLFKFCKFLFWLSDISYLFWVCYLHNNPQSLNPISPRKARIVLRQYCACMLSPCSNWFLDCFTPIPKWIWHGFDQVNICSTNMNMHHF